MRMMSKIGFIVTITILFFECTNQSKNIVSNEENTIYSENNVSDTVINKIKVRITPTRLKSFKQGEDNYEIFASYAYINKDSFDFNKCFESLIITKNQFIVNKLFKADLSKLLLNDYKPNGFRNGKLVEKIVEIKNLENTTFSVVFDFNMSSPGYKQYAFIELHDNISSSDTLYSMYSSWYRNGDIQARDGSFEIEISNHYFIFNLPIKICRLPNETLVPQLDTTKVKIDGNWIVYNLNNEIMKDYSKSKDTIYLYPTYKSKEEEIIAIPLNSLNNIRFSKAARYYEKISTNEFYKFLEETQRGMEMSPEDYILNIDNFNTKWFLYIESGNYKGWVRKEKDYRKLGFNFAG